VVQIPLLAEYANKLTLRLGASGEYKISPRVALFGGVNVITSSYEDGRFVPGGGGVGAAADADETLINAYIGTSVKFTDILFGTLTYNFTNSDSDVANRDYDRNRISVGLRAEF